MSKGKATTGSRGGNVNVSKGKATPILTQKGRGGVSGGIGGVGPSTQRSSWPVKEVLRQSSGIGVVEATNLCRQYSILPATPWGRLSSERRTRLDRACWVLAGRANLKRASSLKAKADTVKGIRIRRGLPSRGQRTQTNASTAKRLNSNRLGR